MQRTPQIEKQGHDHQTSGRPFDVRILGLIYRESHGYKSKVVQKDARGVLPHVS